MRVRATVLLVRHQAMLLGRARGGMWLLPGGMVEPGELTIVAAIRALHEETGVEANAAVYLFQEMSSHHLHHVFRIAIPDDVHPQADLRGSLDELRWVDPSQLASLQTTPGTRAILTRALGFAGNDARAAWNRNGVATGANAGIGRRWR